MTNARMPVTALLGTNMFFSGVTYAATVPYASLVGLDALGMSPAWFATVTALGSVVGTFVSLLLGFLSDKLPDRRVLVLITSVFGMAGHGLIYLWSTQAGFTISTVLLMPLGFAAFSQSFAYVRVFYLKHTPGRADFMVTALRTVFTVAWIIVPPLAGWIAAEFSIFNVYLASALSYAAGALIFAVLMSDPATSVQVPEPVRAEGQSLWSTFALPRSTLAGLVGLVMMGAGTRVAGLTMPLFIVSGLGGDLTHVGIYSGITAATEAPFMLMLAYLTTRLTRETLLSVAGLVMAVFLVLASTRTDITSFYVLLVLNGLALSALMSINISYIQDAIKGRVGLSTSLMDLVAILANLLGAMAFGALVSGGDYRFALVAAAGIVFSGAALMALGNLGRLGRLPKIVSA